MIPLLPEFYQRFQDGSSLSQRTLGTMLMNGNGCMRNYKLAGVYLKQSAEQNNRYGLYNYGIMIQNGKGREPNKEEAMKYFKRSADKGYPRACFNYGTYLLERGDGDSKRYMKRAADGGHDKAQIKYALLCEKDGDIGGAIKYLRMAVSQGNMMAEYQLGRILQKIHDREFMMHIRIAADNGVAPAVEMYRRFVN